MVGNETVRERFEVAFNDYFGPNADELTQLEMRELCHENPECLDELKRRFPRVENRDIQELLALVILSCEPNPEMESFLRICDPEEWTDSELGEIAQEREEKLAWRAKKKAATTPRDRFTAALEALIQGASDSDLLFTLEAACREDAATLELLKETFQSSVNPSWLQRLSGSKASTRMLSSQLREYLAVVLVSVADFSEAKKYLAESGGWSNDDIDVFRNSKSVTGLFLTVRGWTVQK